MGKVVVHRQHRMPAGVVAWEDKPHETAGRMGPGVGRGYRGV